MVDVNTNGQNEEALDLCRQARLLIENQSFEEAAKKLDAAIVEDPMIPEIYKNYGDLHMAREEYEEAKKSYKQALLIEKKGEFFFLYGNACFLNGDEAEGINNYNSAIMNGYDNDTALFYTGLAYEHLNDDGNAIRYFYRASQKNPARPDYKLRIIHTLIRMGDVDKAKEQTDELIETAPELYDGYHIKNLILLSEKKYEEAESAARLAVERFPEDVELFLDYTKVFVERGQTDRAIEMIAKAKQMNYYEVGKRDFCFLEAQMFGDKGDLDRAIASLDECISLEKEDNLDGEARFMKLNMLYVQNKYEEALELANAFVDAQTRDSFYNASLYYKGRCLKELGRAEEAKKAYEDALAILRVVSLAPDSGVDSYLYRAMTLKDMEQFDKALEMLDFVDQLNLDIAETHLIRSEIFKIQNNEVMEKKELEKAYELKPELKPVE